MVDNLLGDDFPFAEDILEGADALVCGASKGIGRSCALMLARSGAKVTVCSRSKDNLEKLIGQMYGSGHDYLVIDLEKLDEVRSELKDLRKYNILINNSGGPPSSPLIENEVEDFLRPFTRHLHASHEITRALIPGMEERGMGRIINIISTSVKEPIDGIGLSNTLRGAMASWSKSMSRELPPCITINNILPGWTDTERLNQLAKTKSEKSGISIEEIFRQWEEMTPIKRLIDPMETAAAVLWLCLPSSESIRGVSLAVDGGRMRSI